MEVQEGYKLTEIGVIPEDWKVEKIKNVCKLINGRGFKPFEWKKEGLPIIRIQNLNGSDEFNYYNGSFDKKILVEHGQLLFAWSGNRGTSFGPYVWNGGKALLNYHTWKIAINEQRISKDFYLHALKELTKSIEDKAHGASALVHTQKGEMENYDIPLPTSKQEQIAIAKVLSNTDALIQSLEKIVVKKQNIKQGTMQLLLTGKKRLPGFSGKWEVKKLGEIVQIEKGQQLNRSTLSEVGSYPVINGGVDPSGFTDKWNTNKNTITISEGGNSCGYVKFMKSDFWCGGHCYALKNLKRELDLYFLYYQLKFNEDLIMKLRIGSGLPNIQKKKLQAFLIRLPNFTEQQILAKFFSDMDKELTALEKKLHKYKFIKQGLMQNLLTGKIRLV